MKKVILDTNFLLIPIKFRVDIFREMDRICDFHYELCVFDSSIDELNAIIEKQKGLDKKAAKFGLKMIALKNMKILQSKESHVDNSIVENADKNTVIATNDIALKKKLIAKKVPVIIMRKREFLKFAN